MSKDYEKNDRIIRTLASMPEIEWASKHQGISDMMFNDPDYRHFHIQVKGELLQYELAGTPTENRNRINLFLEEMSDIQGMPFEDSYPYLTTNLPMIGYRLTATKPPLTKSYTFTIRFGNRAIFDLEQFCDAPTTAYLIELLKDRSRKLTILVAGGTSTGKTSFMNAWLQYLHPKVRVISVENMYELNLPQVESNVGMIAREGLNFIDTEGHTVESYRIAIDCINRSNPGFIVFGELTYQSSSYWLRSCNLDCSSMATLHASSPELAISALQSNISQSTQGREQVTEAKICSVVSHIVQLKRDPVTNVRHAEISEVIRVGTNTYEIKPLEVG